MKQFIQTEDGKYAKIWNDQANATPEQLQEATNAFSKVIAYQYNISLDEAKLIAVDSFIKGANYNQPATNTIVMNANGNNNALDYAETTTHEGTHAGINQGFISNRETPELNEAYAKLMEGYGSKDFVFVYNNAGYGEVKTDNVNKPIAQGDSALIDKNTAWFMDKAMNDPQNVDYKIVINPSLSPEDKKIIMSNLQKLTNDKLTINDKGEVTATNTKQNTKPKGTELVDRLIDSGKTVTITMGNEGNTETDAKSSDSFNHIGTDTTVEFDKNSNPLIQTVDSKTGEIVPKTRPNQVGLGHELVHADRSMRGEAIDYSLKASDKETPQEEQATVGIKYNQPKKDITENDIRKEQGVEPRGRY